MQPTRNLAARAGRWSAQHRRKAVLGWLAFVIAAVMIGGSMGTQLLEGSDEGVGESQRADRAYDKAFPKETSDETVLVQTREGTARDPEFRAAVADVTQRLEATKHVEQVESPYAGDAEGTISRDGRSALVNFKVDDRDDEGSDNVVAALAAVKGAQRAHSDLRIEQFGEESSDRALSKSFEDDFQQAEYTSLPVTLLILLIAFGALVAAAVPLILAVTAVAATIGLIGPISQLFPVSESINSVVLLIGLAVGVDYAMFYLRREREERAAGRSEQAALEAAAATSGRAVLISGLTVMVAMAGMYLAGSSTFSSFATGTILVVAVAVIGSLTVLPALLSKLGDRVDKGRVPFVHRLKRGTGESRVWSAILDRVLRRPLVSALAATALMLALAAPVIGMKTALPGLDTLPRELEVMRTYDRIQAAFPGDQIPADVVVEAGDVRSGEVQAAIAELERSTANSDLLGPPSTEVSPDGSLANISVPIAGDGTNDRSNAALAELREEIVPATFGQIEGVEANVTGVTAGTEDFNSATNSRLPYVFAFVLTAAFALLLVTFRSVVIPLKAIVLNLLSVGAAYGILTLVFQHGWFESLLGFTSTGAVTSWLPLFLFVVLFGLSMDYHVFILTRVREAFDRGMSTEQAVTSGIKSTAGVVTSAALVMVAVFSIFATLSSIEFKQMGVGLASAILIDATLVRGVLLPATMKLLGDWNWYLPRWLEWLPQVSHEPPVRDEELAPVEQDDRERELVGV